MRQSERKEILGILKKIRRYIDEKPGLEGDTRPKYVDAYIKAYSEKEPKLNQKSFSQIYRKDHPPEHMKKAISKYKNNDLKKLFQLYFDERGDTHDKLLTIPKNGYYLVLEEKPIPGEAENAMADVVIKRIMVEAKTWLIYTAKAILEAWIQPANLVNRVKNSGRQYGAFLLLYLSLVLISLILSQYLQGNIDSNLHKADYAPGLFYAAGFVLHKIESLRFSLETILAFKDLAIYSAILCGIAYILKWQKKPWPLFNLTSYYFSAWLPILTIVILLIIKFPNNPVFSSAWFALDIIAIILLSYLWCLSKVIQKTIFHAIGLWAGTMAVSIVINISISYIF